MPTFFGSLSRSICGEFSDELAGEDVHPLGPENHCSFSSDSDSRQDSVGGAVPIQARPENLTDAADFSRPHSSPTESVLTQATLPARRQLHQESGDMIGLTAQTSLQVRQRLVSVRTWHRLVPGPRDGIPLTVERGGTR